MSRSLRVQYPGAFYHITSRGNGGQDTFLSIKDYQKFLAVFFSCQERYNWVGYAYCLMPNHYHLLIQTVDPTLSIGMRQLNGDYTQAFNIIHHRSGHVFQGRFKAMLIEDDIYLYRVLRYVALNPVRAKLVNSPLGWEWSSFSETVGKKKKTGCVDIDRVLRYFDNINPAKARKAMCDYVGLKMIDDNPWVELRGGLILGSDGFVARIKKYLDSEKLTHEIPQQERFAERPELFTIFSEESIKSRPERNRLIYQAHFDYGYSLSEIGRQLNLHYSSISKIIKKDENKKS